MATSKTATKKAVVKKTGAAKTASKKTATRQKQVELNKTLDGMPASVSKMKLTKRANGETKFELVSKSPARTVAEIEKFASVIDGVVVVIRHPKDKLLSCKNAKNPYIASKGRGVKTLKSVQARLAEFGLTPDNYEVISGP